MILRLLLLALLAYVVWQLWRRALSRRAPPQSPSPGFSADPEALVRCDRCGVRVPASQVESVRKNCRQCGDGHSQG